MNICRAMHWSYEELLSLPIDVYEELIVMLNEEAEEQDRRR